MKILDKIIHSNTAPSQTNVLWADSVTNKLKIFKNGKWEVISIEDDPNTGSWAKTATAPNVSIFTNDAGYITLNNISNKANKIPIINYGTSSTTTTLSENVYYIWGEVASLTLTLGTPTDTTKLSEYMFEFVSGSTPTSLTISVPTGYPAIKWPEDWTPEANKIYQVSILNGIGLVVSVDNT